MPSFQLCLKPVAEPYFGRGEGRGQAGSGNTLLSAHACRSWQLATGEGSQTELNCAPLKAPTRDEIWHCVALPFSPAMLKQMGPRTAVTWTTHRCCTRACPSGKSYLQKASPSPAGIPGAQDFSLDLHVHIPTHGHLTFEAPLKIPVTAFYG